MSIANMLDPAIDAAIESGNEGTIKLLAVLPRGYLSAPCLLAANVGKDGDKVPEGYEYTLDGDLVPGPAYAPKIVALQL